MKGTRLKDVLNDVDKKQNWIITKFGDRYKRIESNNPNIDNFEYRWVEKKIEDLENGLVLEKEDLEKANAIWKKWR